MPNRRLDPIAGLRHNRPAMRLSAQAREPVVLIVDDDAQVARCLARVAQAVFSTRIVGSLRAAQEAIAEEVLAGIILDVRLPDGSGLDLFRHLADQGITTRVLVLTGYLERAAVAETQMYGAEFLTKPFEPRHVEAFINRLRSATPARDTWRRLVAVAQERGLTERETEVVSLHLLGLSRTAIAERLRISINTVKMHISAILQKTGADSLNDLTARVGAP